MESYDESYLPTGLTVTSVRGNPVDTVTAAASLSPQEYQQLIDRISELKTRMVALHSHAEAQQVHIRVAEVVIQQLLAAGTPTNPPPQFRAASQKQVT